MSFDQNKANLLQQLQKQKHDQIMRQRGLEAQNRLRDKGQEQNVARVSPQEIDDSRKAPVAIFGVKTPFMATLKSLLQQYCQIHEFDNIDRASDYLFANQVPIAVMDMDPPNDWKACHDFFSTGKTINPSLQYIVYQKDELYQLEEPVEILQKQGATILKKPLDRMELVDLLKKIIAEWKEKNA